MAAGFPAKTSWATGDVLTAAGVDDLAGTLNLLKPSAKGSIFGASAVNVPSELLVGADGTILTADSASAGGVKWASGASSMSLISTTAITAVASISLTSIPQTYKELVILIDNAATVNTGIGLTCTFNSDTATHYSYQQTFASSTSSNNAAAAIYLTGATSIGTTASVNNINMVARIQRYAATTGYKLIKHFLTFISATTSQVWTHEGVGASNQTAAITSIQIAPSAGNFVAQGNIYLYGVN